MQLVERWRAFGKLHRAENRGRFVGAISAPISSVHGFSDASGLTLGSLRLHGSARAQADDMSELVHC